MTIKKIEPSVKAAKKTAIAPKATAKTAAPKIKKPAKTVVSPKTATKLTATVTVKQTGSHLRRDSRQKLYLLSLGLGKMNRVRTLPDTPSVRGLINKVQHMVTVLS